jgi:C-terminal processing protease CtpA/Prc
MNGLLTLTLEDPTGSRRVVTVAPQPIEDYFDVATRAVSDRMAGPLSEFGAPDIYYLNMNFFVLFARSQMLAAIAEATARGSNGLVLDMRDYPGVSNYEVASRLIQEPFLSPMFLVNRLTSTGAPSTESFQRQVFPISNPSFAGPIVLLTSPHAVSAAENFMQMLVGADRLRAIVGRQSAGTNGNISAISLPGGFEFSFTGRPHATPSCTSCRARITALASAACRWNSRQRP